MTKTTEDLLAELSRRGIQYTLRRHEPVPTVAAMLAVLGDLPGAHTKNLFLRDAKKSYFLVSMLHDAQADLKAMRPLIGARGNLSFASAESLLDKLGVTSGAVSPLAVVNDTAGEVAVCLQDALLGNAAVNVHALTSTTTVSLTSRDLEAFLVANGHRPKIFSLAS